MKGTTNIEHVPQYGGTIYYVDGTNGSDTNTGKEPCHAVATIGQAITNSSAGDRISVRAGTYDEDGLDLATNGLQLIGEVGAEINNSETGTCLTVSGNACVVSGIKVEEAGEIGIHVTGAGCVIRHVVASTCSVAFDIDGSGNTLEFCQDLNATVTGYDISSAENLLYLCNSLATAGGSSRGFYLSNGAADRNMLYQCVSVGNGTAGYEIITGCADNVVAYCTSGGGDGARVDADEVNVWTNFGFDNNINKHNTLSIGAGGATDTAYNLFKVTGTVKINSIVGVVETALTGTNTDCFLDVYSATSSTRLSKDDAGVTLGAAIVGSAIARLDKEDKVLTFTDAAGPGLMDEIDTKKEGFRLIEDRTGATHVATYIRFVHTGAAACTGLIDWYVDWAPVSDDGFLAPV